MNSRATEQLPDTEVTGLLRLLPAAARPFALLARFDRPIGWWLLYWPCTWGVLLAGGLITHWPLLLWLLLGAIAMRGAGCVYNDIVDRDLDRQVARTAMRPLASGAVSVRAAWGWLIGLSLIGLVVLMQLNGSAQLLALASLLLVAAYPFMKRFTWWPQAWLGLVFSWGALVGWVAVAEQARPAMFLLYGGAVLWVIGYDTIYALQDIDDDAMIGIRSSARRLGNRVRGGVVTFYLGAIALWGGALWLTRPEPVVLLALAPAGVHLIWQVATLAPADGANARARFRSNRFTGLLVAAAMLVVGTTA
jgi:4-hydroxybenzoate polyprenyltransferase